MGSVTRGRTDALVVVTRAVWGRPEASPSDDVLHAATALARRNGVEAFLARAYPDRLRPLVAEVSAAGQAFRENLRTACGLLLGAGVEPVLIKADPREDHTYSNFDLVVGDDGWSAAVGALRAWARRTSTHPLERRKLLMHPERGPAAHLHRSVSWFDIPVIGATELRARARREDDAAWWEPDAPDALRITLAHAGFQNLAIDLSELWAIRPLLGDAAEARARAADEGWARAFDELLALATAAIEGIEGGRPPSIPVEVPPRSGMRIALEHAASLWRAGSKSTSAREVALRPILVAAKRRRLRLA